jgi:ubiquinone/menaquinone biosynthesis C-methylase UbiE
MLTVDRPPTSAPPAAGEMYPSLPGRVADRLFTRLLSSFFRELYTRLAFAYDAVAWIASLGHWQEWQQAAVVPLPRSPCLELGHGPGHLLAHLLEAGAFAVGVDRSRQMTAAASRRLARLGRRGRVVRAQAEALPFASGCFRSLLATFPSEYISQPVTLREAFRVLDPSGRLIILPVAYLRTEGLLLRWAAWLFRATRQSAAVDEAAWRLALADAGFEARFELVPMPGADVVRITAELPPARD